MEVFKQLRSKRTVPIDDVKHSLEASENRIRNFIELHAKGVCPYKIVTFPFSVPEGATLISPNEVPFAIDIGAQLLLLGRIDFPAEIRQTGELWAADYKTSSEISGRLWEAFDLNAQAIGYTIALSHIANRRVSGLLIEAIRKSTDIKKTEVALHFQYVTEEDFEFFLGYMQTVAANVLACNDRRRWPKVLSGCNSYATTGFPGSNCPFKLLCKAKDWREVERFYAHKKPFHPFNLDTGE
jgi:hypothetical protein